MKRQRKDWIPGRTSSYVNQGPCPACKTVMQILTNLEKGSDEFPEPGAWCVCLHCSAMNILDENLKLREPTKAELVLALTADHEFRHVASNAMRTHLRWKARL